MLLHLGVHNQVQFTYVLSDLWYAAADNMKYLHHVLRKHFVLPLKENRKLAVRREDQQKGQYVSVSTLNLPVGTTREIWLEDVDFPLLLTKEVFKNADGSTGLRYLVSDDLTLTYDHITTLFQKRWSVEVYHKSLKQNVALEQSPTRTVTTQRNHLFASLCAYLKLERLKIKTKLNHFALKTKLYQAATRAAFAELVKLKDQFAHA